MKVSLGLVLLAGCAVKRDAYHVPQVVLPQRFLKAASVVDVGRAPEDAQNNALAPGALNTMLGEWWLLLGSPELNAFSPFEDNAARAAGLGL